LDTPREVAALINALADAKSHPLNSYYEQVAFDYVGQAGRALRAAGWSADDAINLVRRLVRESYPSIPEEAAVEFALHYFFSAPEPAVWCVDVAWRDSPLSYTGWNVLEESPTDALRSALRNLDVIATLARPDAFREQVCAAVDHLKKSGLSPEHVVLAIKGIVYEANMRVADVGLIDQMVQWCIERYFAPDQDRQAREEY
jgi:hypothetical protein